MPLLADGDGGKRCCFGRLIFHVEFCEGFERGTGQLFSAFGEVQFQIDF